MKKSAIVAGNHWVDKDSIRLEENALSVGFPLHGDPILFFDQSGITVPELVTDVNKLFLFPVSFFSRKEELPEKCREEGVYIILENSLRNYARRKYGKWDTTSLCRNMYKDREDGLISCNCKGVYVSLIEILYKRYEKVIWVVEKKSNRTKIGDVLMTQVVFPDLKVIWV
jgi:hypothetical protein